MNKDKKILLLLVDDDEVDREMIIRSLRSLNAIVKEAKNCQEALEQAPKEEFNLILLDYLLPDGNGLELVPKLRKLGVLTPIILVTGFGTDDLVVDTQKAGLLDYVPKSNITPEFLTRSVLNAMALFQTKLEKEQAETDYRELYNLSPVGLYRSDTVAFIRANTVCAKILGCKNAEDVIGRKIADFLPNFEMNGKSQEVEITRLDGKKSWVQWTGKKTNQDYIDGCLLDINEFKKVKATLAEVQKREIVALGKLQELIKSRLAEYN